MLQFQGKLNNQHINIQLNLVLLVVALIVFSIGCKPQKLEIFKVDALSIDTTTQRSTDNYSIKTEVYLVRGYQDNEACDAQIDNFVSKYEPAASVLRNTFYVIQFFKESPKTNIKAISSEKWDLINKYSQEHDAISIYTFSNGKFIREKFKRNPDTGEEIKKKDKIKIEEIRTE